MRRVPRNETRRSNKQTPPERNHHVAGLPMLVFAGLFLLVFAAFGGWHFIGSLTPLTWKSVPCRLVSFKPTEHADSEHPFGADVLFRFRWRAMDHQGSQLGIAGWKHGRDQLRHQLEFEQKTDATCYLPDGDPSKAVLLRPSPAWGGLIFVAFSSCVGWILYQAHRGRNLPTAELTPKVLPVVGVFFGGAGLLMALTLSLPVWIETLQVRSWRETEATVAWSRLRTHTTGGKSRRSVQRADICYEYEAGGRSWRNNHLHPGGLAASGSRTANALLSSHPTGKRVTCYVDPQHPERSLLFASSGLAAGWTLFPIPFLAVGGLFIKSAFQAKNQARGKR